MISLLSLACLIGVTYGYKLNFTTPEGTVITSNVKHLKSEWSANEKQDTIGVYGITIGEDKKFQYPALANSGQKEEIVDNQRSADNDGKSYKYQYSTSQLVIRKEQGKLQKQPDGSEALEVEGSSLYLNDDVPVAFVYTADKNGVHAKFAFGSKIPVEVISLLVDRQEMTPASTKGIGGNVLAALVGKKKG